MYAKKVTKEYLIKLGITNVTEDGRVFKNGKELKGAQTKEGYTMLTLYDPDLFAVVYPITKQTCAGDVNMCVHRVVYA